MSESFNNLVSQVHSNRKKATLDEVRSWLRRDIYYSLASRTPLFLFAVLSQRSRACELCLEGRIRQFSIISNLNIHVPNGYYILPSINWFMDRVKVDLRAFPDHFSVRNLTHLEIIKLFKGLPNYEECKNQGVEVAIKNMEDELIHDESFCSDNRVMCLDPFAPISETMSKVKQRLEDLKSEYNVGKQDIPFFTEDGISKGKLIKVFPLIDLYLSAYVRQKKVTNKNLVTALSDLNKSTMHDDTFIDLRENASNVLEDCSLNGLISEYAIESPPYNPQ